jgi:hypothetical protein
LWPLPIVFTFFSLIKSLMGFRTCYPKIWHLYFWENNTSMKITLTFSSTTLPHRSWNLRRILWPSPEAGHRILIERYCPYSWRQGVKTQRCQEECKPAGLAKFYLVYYP